MKTLIVLENKEFSLMPDLFANDVGQKLTFFLRDNVDNLLDITGASISFKIKKVNTDSNKVDSACVLDDPVNGECSYTTVSVDLDTPGVYDAELQIVLGGATTTAPLGRFKIQEDLPNV